MVLFPRGYNGTDPTIPLQITSFNTSLPLKLQAHAAVGYLICFLAMIGIYYNNVWDSFSQPFMSTRLRAANGTAYPIDEVFVGGVLDEDALTANGIPRLSGSFAYAMLMANAAVSIQPHQSRIYAEG